MDNYLIVLKQTECGSWGFTMYRSGWRRGWWRGWDTMEEAEEAALAELERTRWMIGPLAVGEVKIEVAQ